MKNVTLYSFGSNQYGQLGLGHTNDISFPSPVMVPHSVEMIQKEQESSTRSPIVFHSSGCHTMLYEPSGQTLVGWGNNQNHQLGSHGQSINYREPVLLKSPTSGMPITSIACGWEHSLFLTSTGQVFGRGSNQYGQLTGKPSLESEEEPSPRDRRLDEHIQVRTHTSVRITEIAAGWKFSCCRSDSGQVWHVGLIPGKSTLRTNASTTDDGGTTTVDDMRITEMTSSIVTQVMDEEKPAVIRIAAGWHHVAMVLVTGQVCVYGKNQHGQFGGHRDTRVSAEPVIVPNVRSTRDLVSGWHHLLAMDPHDASCVWSWGGQNEFGQLGRPSSNNASHDDDDKSPAPIPYFLNPSVEIHSIQCGSNHSLVCT